MLPCGAILVIVAARSVITRAASFPLCLDLEPSAWNSRVALSSWSITNRFCSGVKYSFPQAGYANTLSGELAGHWPRQLPMSREARSFAPSTARERRSARLAAETDKSRGRMLAISKSGCGRSCRPLAGHVIERRFGPISPWPTGRQSKIKKIRLYLPARFLPLHFVAGPPSKLKSSPSVINSTCLSLVVGC